MGQQTVVLPGYDGGAEWGGQAADAVHGILYLNANDVAWTVGLEANRAAAGQPGRSGRLIGDNGVQRSSRSRPQGMAPPAFPSLVGSALSAAQMADVVHAGRGRMPSFNIQGDTILVALRCHLRGEKRRGQWKWPPRRSVRCPAAALPFHRLSQIPRPRWLSWQVALSPWGTLSAIDLNSGTYLSGGFPFGEYPSLADKSTGSENYGGPILTAGGVLFIAATLYDKKIRAFDPRDGKLLWDAALPYAGNATPITL